MHDVYLTAVNLQTIEEGTLAERGIVHIVEGTVMDNYRANRIPAKSF